MASTVPNKVFIQVESSKEQQENIKVSRKSSRTLAVIQKTGAIIDKENLVGRQPAFIAKEQLIKKTIDNDTILSTPEHKRKLPTSSQETQTSPSLIKPSGSSVTEADLTSDEAGEGYWKVLAEKRRAALEESLTENQELYERIASLESELNESKSLLEDAQSLVETLTEMLQENEPPQHQEVIVSTTDDASHEDQIPN